MIIYIIDYSSYQPSTKYYYTDKVYFMDNYDISGLKVCMFSCIEYYNIKSWTNLCVNNIDLILDTNSLKHLLIPMFEHYKFLDMSELELSDYIYKYVEMLYKNNKDKSFRNIKSDINFVIYINHDTYLGELSELEGIIDNFFKEFIRQYDLLNKSIQFFINRMLFKIEFIGATPEDKKRYGISVETEYQLRQRFRLVYK